MRHWTVRRIIICLLGILLGLGMGLSAVQASGMTAKMALAGQLDAPDDACKGCGGDDPAQTANCLSICAASVFALTVPTAVPARMEPARSFLCEANRLHSTPPSPDPHPPRPAFLL